MGEVDGRPVDDGGELRPRVEFGLGRAPVVGVPPVVREFAQIGGRDAVRPAGGREIVRPAGAVEPCVEVVEVALRNVDTERRDAVG